MVDPALITVSNVIFFIIDSFSYEKVVAKCTAARERKNKTVLRHSSSNFNQQLRGNLSKQNVDMTLTQVDVYRIFQNLPDVDA